MHSEPSVFAYYSDYILRCSLLRRISSRHIALFKHVVFSVISFIATAQDGTTEKGRCYDRVPHIVESEVLVPLPLRLVEDITKLFSHCSIDWL